MKYIKPTIVATLLCTISLPIVAQTLNWASLQSNQKHIINVNAGWEHGFVYGAGYSYRLRTKTPLLLHVAYSFPSGSQVLDDGKARLGGKIQWYRIKHFQVSSGLYGIYRQYQNPLVRQQNFGAEVNTTVGFYKPKWFVAAEAGFDKAIVTHFKHSESYRTNVYANAIDGWYQPATGGNFTYGLQAGYSFSRSDALVSIGKVVAQDFKTAPLIPLYFQMGYNLKFRKD